MIPTTTVAVTLANVNRLSSVTPDDGAAQSGRVGACGRISHLSAMSKGYLYFFPKHVGARRRSTSTPWKMPLRIAFGVGEGTLAYCGGRDGRKVLMIRTMRGMLSRMRRESFSVVPVITNARLPTVM